MLHENRMAQTIFFFALIEIPSMVHTRRDRKLPEVKMSKTPHIFKLLALPDNNKLASLHCAKKSSNDSNQIELAILHVRESEWIVEKRVAVDPKSSDLNYIAKVNLLAVSSCSEISLFNAMNLQLVK